MTIKFNSIFASALLMMNVSVANADPIGLSTEQMDLVTAGGTVSVTARATGNGYLSMSSSTGGTITTKDNVSGGYAVAWGFGSSTSSAITSGGANGTFIAISNTNSGTAGQLAYSVTVVAAY